ncbi:nickel pincer cofactor biosynthesis protein LarB [Candidatus Bathyarchaeota archaeon]|nr:MAG: nickel pincer cofactor biosynthesis protein LarB [Candidatus Bathyarchaeota archaeon]
MKRLRDILKKVAKGEISVEEAERLLRILAIEEVGNMAKIDIGREHRRGIPEVILAEGKTPEDLAEITVKMLKKSGRAIISRVTKEQIHTIKDALPKDADVEIHSKARIIIVRMGDLKVEKTGGKIGILTAGTSDIQVAEEARIIAEEMGCEVITAYDVGLAGIHRLIPPLKEMIAGDVDVLIVVAGREGALPTVVAGMVDLPVIAVPTSVGYGLGEKGISALIAMLQSCSLGLAVVNIDGGVAAGAIAAMIANRIAKFKRKS